MKKIMIAGLMLMASVLILPAISLAADISCRPDYNGDLVGKTINWSISGDTAGYTFTWDDGVTTDTGETFSNSYADEGEKVVSLTMDDGVASSTISCSSVNIYTPETVPTISASCTPSPSGIAGAVIGQTVTWSADLSGGLSPQVESWSGDDSLSGSGDSMETSYSVSGIKTAKMDRVSSRYADENPANDRFYVENVACSKNVSIYGDEIYFDDLVDNGATCSVNDSTIYAGGSVTWTADLTNISGGQTPYSVSWIGTDGLEGDGNSITKTYSTSGTKSAYFSVSSNDGQSIDVNCAVTVDVRANTGGGGNAGELISCTYEYSSTWSACVNGEQTRTVTPDPAGCLNQPEEPVVRACTIGGTDNGTSTATSTNNNNNTNNSTSTDNSNNTNDGNNNNQNSDSTDDNQNDTGRENPDYIPNPEFIFGEDQSEGDRNQDVANLQGRLNDEGFYFGPITGFFGAFTTEAVKEYQRANGLPVTGKLDEATRAKLNAEIKEVLASTTVGDLIENTSTSSAGLLAAAAGLVKDNGRNVVYIILGLILLGLVSWGVMAGFRKDKNIA